MNRSTGQILTTHSGSLIRTLEIIEGMKARALGEPLDEEKFQAGIASGIADVVRRQVEAGITVPNDGEYARQNFRTYIGERLGGLERVELKPSEGAPLGGQKRERALFPGAYDQYYGRVQYEWMLPEVDMSKMTGLRGKKQAFRVVAPIYYIDTAVQNDIANLKAALSGLEVEDAFISAVTPTNMSRKDAGILDFYESFEAYQYAMADVMREEYKAITDAGFILQLDRPAQDPTMDLESDEDIAKALDAAIEVENYALRGIPAERVRLHWCGGSSNLPHTENIPFRKVAKSMLKLNVGAYGLEAANPRHELEWQIWEDIKLPEGKALVPGLVSQSTNVVEPPELIAWRIENFARLVGRENVIAGVDCGFSQSWEYPRTHSEIQWAKLRSLADGAAIASSALWGTSKRSEKALAS